MQVDAKNWTHLFFEWTDIDNNHVQLIHFKASFLWIPQFVHLPKSSETTEKNHQIVSLTCRASLLKKFSCLKKVATAMLSTFKCCIFFDKYFYT